MVACISGLIVAICGLTGLAFTRYASILSTSVAVSSVVVLTIGALLGLTPYIYILGSVLTMLVMFYALRDNFARIRAGTERKVGQKTENIAKI